MTGTAVEQLDAAVVLITALQIPGQAQTFLDHIKLGIETAATDPNALLLFSGGQTRQAAGPRSEGLSYWTVAEAAKWYGHEDVRSRAFTEVSRVCSDFLQMILLLNAWPVKPPNSI